MPKDQTNAMEEFRKAVQDAAEGKSDVDTRIKDIVMQIISEKGEAGEPYHATFEILFMNFQRNANLLNLSQEYHRYAEPTDQNIIMSALQEMKMDVNEENKREMEQVIGNSGNMQQTRLEQTKTEELKDELLQRLCDLDVDRAEEGVKVDRILGIKKIMENYPRDSKFLESIYQMDIKQKQKVNETK